MTQTPRTSRYLLPVLLLFFSFLGSHEYSRAVDLAPPDPFEQTATTAYPAVYGEIFNHYSEIANTSDDAVKVIYNDIDKYNKYIGRIAGVIDVGGKAYAGQYDQAAISAALTGLNELAASSMGKALLSSAGLTTAPITALTMAVPIWLASRDALHQSTVGRKLESLYGTIEADRLLKDRERQMGEGDPIPVNMDSINYVWKKVVLSDAWQDLFKVYVVEELGKTWPEPSYWQSWTVPSDVLGQSMLVQKREEYQGYIAGLLSSLNKVARVREQQYIARKHISELQKSMGSLDIKAILARVDVAFKALPEVRTFAQSCPEKIKQGIAKNNVYVLQEVILGSRERVSKVLFYLPTQGAIGSERQKLIADLSSYHDQAKAAFDKAWESSEEKVVKEVAAMDPPGWRATRHSFGLHFNDIQGQALQEILETGAVAKTTEKINKARKLVMDQYGADLERVRQEYVDASRNPPVPLSRNKAAFQSFEAQLKAYMQLDGEAAAVVSVQVSGLVQSMELLYDQNGNRAWDLNGQLDRKVALFKNQFNTFRQKLEGYCLLENSLPSSGYVGIINLDFPDNAPEQDSGAFSWKYVSFLTSRSNQLQAGSRLSLCSREYGLSQMIDIASNLYDEAVAIAGSKEAVASALRDLEALEDFLQTEIVRSTLPDQIHEQMKRYAPFLREVNDIILRAESLERQAEKALNNYMQDFANLENDLAYLERLRRILAPLDLAIQDFRARYRHFSANPWQSNGYFIVAAGLLPGSGPLPCDIACRQPLVMSRSDIDSMVVDFHRHMAERGLYWLSDKYQLGIREHLNYHIETKTVVKRAWTPEQYAFIEFDGDCRIFPKEFFDTLAANLEAVPIASPADFTQLANNLHKAVRTNVALFQDDTARLLTIPYTTDLNTNQHLPDIRQFDPLPLRTAAGKIWDRATAESIMRVVEALVKIKDALVNFGEKEARFNTLWEQLMELTGKARNSEYNARAVYNKDSFDPRAVTLYEQAIAMEGPIFALLSTAAGDSDLSPARKQQFAGQGDELTKFFDSLKSFLQRLKRQTGGSQSGQQLVQATEVIGSFYEGFKAAYEGKNEGLLLSSLSDDWQAGDGTTLADLEEYFRNMFTVFDLLQFKMGGINVQPAATGADRYIVSYELTIIGRIFDAGLVHEEQSAVSEEVSVSGSTVKIIHTPQGRFWYIQ